MKSILHKSSTRGLSSIGWLHSHHTFSFGGYFDPNRMNFGLLRVLNDDIVQPGMGFGTHPHDNMEIISIPLEGALAHKDSSGNTEVIHTGDVQIMSAGSGLSHSEFNHSQSKKVNFLQIWVLPKERNIQPRYEQKTFDASNRLNKIQTVVAPDDPSAVWINQNAWFQLVDLDGSVSLNYELKEKQNGAYIFVLSGDVTVNEIDLSHRDGLGIYDTDSVSLSASNAAKLLIMEVPMK